MIHLDDLQEVDVFQAYYDCSKRKRNKPTQLAFEINLVRNLLDLYEELVDGSYKPGISTMFVTTRPKPREIWAADFRDRIVHHILYNKISDYYHRRFIHDSYACIPGKGTLAAAERVHHFVRSITNNDQIPAYYAQVDIANFFVSIDKTILFDILKKHIPEGFWLDLTKTIVFHDPRENVQINSSRKLLNLVPKHKSLFATDALHGLPIGNLSSQFFANVYMNEFDQYAKHGLQLTRYARYVDDMVFLHYSKEYLEDKIYWASKFLQDNLHIDFHPNKTKINEVSAGINFVGFIIKNSFAKTLRSSTIHNAWRAIETKKGDDLTTSLNSYLGMMKQTNNHVTRLKMENKLRELTTKKESYTMAPQYNKVTYRRKR